MTAVFIATVPDSATASTSICNLKHLCPRYFADNLQLVRAALIVGFENLAMRDYFSNVVIGVKIVITEAVCCFLAKVHTF